MVRPRSDPDQTEATGVDAHGRPEGAQMPGGVSPAGASAPGAGTTVNEPPAELPERNEMSARGPDAPATDMPLPHWPFIR